MKKAALLLLLAALLCPAPRVHAQRVLGTVREEGSTGIVVGADVAVLIAGRARGRVVTDSLGRFVLNLEAGGKYTVEVRHIGYAPFSSAIFDVGPSETVTLEIRVGRSAVPLDPLIVTARSSDPRLTGFHERRLSHAFGGRYLTRQDIDRRSAGRTTDLLRGMAGVSIVPVRRGRATQTGNLIGMRGAFGTCEPAIWIDGVRVRQLAESTMDDVLNPHVLEGVEVYTSSASAPAQFSDQGTCGVIAFWTRRGDREGGSRLTWKRLAIGAGLFLLIATAFVWS